MVLAAPPGGALPALRSRGDASEAHVDFAELAPDVDSYLGQVAYLQLGFFQSYLDISATPRAEPERPSQRRRARRSPSTRASSQRFARRGETHRGDGAVRARDRPFLPLTRGHPSTRACSPVHHAGFSTTSSSRCPPAAADIGARYASLLGPTMRPASWRSCQAAIADDEEWRSLFAVGTAAGRRHPARGAALRSDLRRSHQSDEERIEPVFTELIATHTRRMDALGLTA